ncbi:MAG: hypothetical protein EHM33_10520 [Chloroflexi bacterium]|nr:MAG: hypothetical protein EHM33_10520 [Chloroflexota bacterium]
MKDGWAQLLLFAVVRGGIKTQLRREAEALKALEESTRQRIEYLTFRLGRPPLPILTPVPVTVSGATVFALPVEHFEEI